MSQASLAPRIGVSACFFHADPERPIFKGKTLLYLEQSMAHYVMRGGAIPYMIPSAGGPWKLVDLLDGLEGLVLQGGADVAPLSYGEEPLRPEWSGDAVRDAYEVALVEACETLGKPVLGICRGAQVINVARGGTLFQDITTQVEGALVHRDHGIYDRNSHRVQFSEPSSLRAIYGGAPGGRINSVHHQAINTVGRGLRVEATAPDGIIEAVRATDGPYMLGVQWHPEFQNPSDTGLLSPDALMADFLAAVQARRGPAGA